MAYRYTKSLPTLPSVATISLILSEGRQHRIWLSLLGYSSNPIPFMQVRIHPVMVEISDSLRLLYETQLEERGDEYVLTLPKELVKDGSVSTDNSYRVALLESAVESHRSEPESSETDSREVESDSARQVESQGPPVEVGDVRSVTIDTLGDQGDGIAKVERGFIVIVPDTRPGDRVDVEITNVADSVAFAEPVSKAEVR